MKVLQTSNTNLASHYIMRQSAVNIIFIATIIIIVYVKFNESKPLRFNGVNLDELGYYNDQSDLSNAPLLVKGTLENIQRSKRNCFLYALKLQNRAPKWMCW
ncbi:unnamed protein product [Rotaria socialis]|uniref:Uncharacterized protein n=3 Tax=Rotaria socialis TaxID=392032 RepID=A0A817YNM8_9BILA|nr:unnamed protein product [Rotaria socialis]CAF3442250.1 unnamed protein product [Rotaria socialis]